MIYDANYYLKLITESLPRELFTEMREAIDAAFYKAFRDVSEPGRFQKPEFREALGRHRHWECEAIFRGVGERVGLDVRAPHTIPHGGRYSLIHGKGFIIGRAKIDRPYDLLRATKYRAQFAEMNAFVSYKQSDLFIVTPEPSEGPRYSLFIAGADKNNPSAPAFVNFAIPNHDLTGWLFNRPVEKVIAAFTKEEVIPEIIVDHADVALKKKPRKKS